MEEQDRFLILTLKSYGFTIPPTIESISQLQDEHIVSIMLQFLEQMGMEKIDVSSLRSLKGSKYRQASKIQEHCQTKYGIRFEAETLLNPSVNESRRLLVNCLSKLSSNLEEEKSKQLGTELSFEERVKRERIQRSQKLMKEFTDNAWVNPKLINHISNDQRFLKLNLQSKDLILNQITGLRNYLFNSLGKSLMQDESKKILKTDLQEKFKLIKRLRRQENPDQFLLAMQEGVQDDQGLEGQDWVTYQKGSRVIQKAVKQMKQDDVVEINIDATKTMYSLEIQFQEDVLESVDDMQRSTIGDIESELKQIRKSNREEVQALQQEVLKGETRLDSLIAKRIDMEENIQRKQDQAALAREATLVAQKEMEIQHLVLQQVQKKSSDNDAAVEISKLNQENEDLKQEWQQQKSTLDQQISEMRTKASERKDRMQQLTQKIKRLDEENQMIKVDGRNNIQAKEDLIKEYQSMPKETLRSTFIRKIQDLSLNLKKAKEDHFKSTVELGQLEDKINLQNNFINRFNTELENLFKTDPKAKDIVVKGKETVVQQIVQKYENYKQLYKDTQSSIREISKMKIELQEKEQKTDQLISKGYRQNIDKMKGDLQQISQENAQLNKQK